MEKHIKPKHIHICMGTRVYYDGDYDNLIISDKRLNEKVKNNFVLDDNLIISQTRSGRIVGIEVMNISDYLNESGFDFKILKYIKSAELIISPKKEFIFIGFRLNYKPTNNSPEKKIKIPVTHLPNMCLYN